MSGRTVNAIQADFSTGEMSPRLLARVDLEVYRSGVKSMINAHPQPYGGASRRTGTTHHTRVHNSTRPVRLIPFVFSKTVAYVLVFNGGKIEIIKNGSLVQDGVSGDSHGVETNVYSISCPYSDSELSELTYVQIGTSMYIAHSNHPPRVLTTSGDTSWSLSNVSFTYEAIADYWYANSIIRFKIINGSTKFELNDTFTISAPGGVVTPGTNTGNGTIAGVEFLGTPPAETWTVTCTFVDADRQLFTVTGSVSGVLTSKWTTNDYPGAVAFYQRRLYWGGTPSFPQTIWGSKIGEVTNYTLGARDDDAIEFEIASSSYDKIVHLVSARHLLALSYGTEFAIQGSDATGITPSAIKPTAQTYHGSASVRPVRIGQEVLFLPRGRKMIRAISYSLVEDINQAPNISIIAEHLSSSGIKDMSFAQDPLYLCWIVSDDGRLFSLTHIREFSVTGWAQHTTDGQFEAVATIPSGENDITYTVVKRNINGSDVKYIESMNYTTGRQTDCSVIKSSGTPTDTWSGLSHLEGKSVSIVADGLIHPEVTVTGGSITLQYPASSIEVGLPYTTTIELLHPDVNLGDGTSQGRRVRVHEIVLRVKDSTGLAINEVELPARHFGIDTFDSPPTPFSGFVTYKLTGWATENNILITQTMPKATTILSAILKLNVND